MGRCPLPGWLVQYEAERTELTIEPEDLMLDSMALEPRRAPLPSKRVPPLQKVVPRREQPRLRPDRLRPSRALLKRVRQKIRLNQIRPRLSQPRPIKCRSRLADARHQRKWIVSTPGILLLALSHIFISKVTISL